MKKDSLAYKKVKIYNSRLILTKVIWFFIFLRSFTILWINPICCFLIFDAKNEGKKTARKYLQIRTEQKTFRIPDEVFQNLWLPFFPHFVRFQNPIFMIDVNQFSTRNCPWQLSSIILQRNLPRNFQEININYV